jgi:hypothetical protein
VKACSCGGLAAVWYAQCQIEKVLWAIWDGWHTLNVVFIPKEWGSGAGGMDVKILVACI